MPAPVKTSAPSTKASGNKPRVARRRRRGRRDVESDEEIEREAASDSDSVSDVDSALSSVDSETQSPGASSSKAARPNSMPFFAPSSANWSDMVTAEQTNGASEELPVVDFADLQASPTTHTPSANGDAPSSPNPSRGAMRGARGHRPLGQSARQAYQNRLDKDPSYVPTVGEFWGHDDRLLDKDLRSLSNWWRGRWQNRARGFDVRRGRGGRGRGGFGPKSPAASFPPSEGDAHEHPVDRPWGHDGFEELKRREQGPPIRGQHPPRGFLAARGGRAAPPFMARGGRGGGFARGGALPFAPARFRSPLTAADRPWFAMKPEQMWTKQSDGFLFYDNSSRWNPGQVVTVRVKLGDQPAKTAQIIVPQQQRNKSHSVRIESSEEAELFVVRLPPSDGPPATITKVTEPGLLSAGARSTPPPSSSNSAVPHVSTAPLDAPVRPAAPESESLASPPSPATPPPVHQSHLVPEPITRIDNNGFIHAPPAHLLLKDDLEPRSQPHSLEATPPISAFPIPSAGSPYGSPYHYPTPLPPPGITYNQFGQAFEIATGRPVYMPPPQMYMAPPPPAPVPIPGPSVPTHARHYSSVGPDFVNYVSQNGVPSAPPSAPVEQAHSPSSYFSYPRQTPKVDLKRPDGQTIAQFKPPATSRPSHTRGLSVAAPVFEPTPSSSSISPGASTPQEGYPPHMNGYDVGPSTDYPGMYAHGYYYPQDAYSGYGQYIHPGEMQPYHGTTYYHPTQ
ncbi:hypothetical protein DL96DRAFT_1592289 [Flagelloscypha sp. PMI_526]|nr:hypothetical protein DL96DRAFT_1592289 [Flagelloscypha sp. PMI_526]